MLKNHSTEFQMKSVTDHNLKLKQTQVGNALIFIEHLNKHLDKIKSLYIFGVGLVSEEAAKQVQVALES